MKTHFFDEPLLEFANDSHECPRFGISNFETYDSQPSLVKTKPTNIVLGIVGTEQTFEQFEGWLKLCSDFIPEKPSHQSNLFTSFCGFNEFVGFNATMVHSQPYFRQINDTEINKIIKDVKTKGRHASIADAAELYLQHIKFLAQNKNPQVIICIIPDKLFSKVLKVEKAMDSDDKDQPANDSDVNFHHLLKAKSMQYKIPIQIVRERTLSIEPLGENVKSDLQDLATRAWNFCTAVYYKAGGIAWKAPTKEADNLTCFVGISFYRSLDKQTLQTSLAQIFDEQGKGVILRGSAVEIDKKGDRQPHLSGEQAEELLLNAIEAYKFAEGVSPKRVVLHKSSKYTEDEVEGFTKAVEAKQVSTFDFVNIQESDLRLFRTGNYPPLRGISLELNETNHLLYTKSSVSYYQTYAGMYIPQPIEIRIEALNSSSRRVCEEIMSLTKMNWNNTQFDGKMPITIECSRSVGSILKYLDASEKPETRYSFYM